jgi:hypothetical protein
MLHKTRINQEKINKNDKKSTKMEKEDRLS